MKVRVLLLSCLVCIGSLALKGQGFGTIVGTVTDPSGAFVASAKVTVTNQGTSQSRETTTNAEGYFVVPSLQPAAYDVKVEGTGFSPFVQKNVLLAADQTLTVNSGLSVQKTSTEVDVSASPVQVDTSTSTIAEVVVRCHWPCRARSVAERRDGPQTEARQHGPAVLGKQDVRRLDVTMDGGARVRVVQS